MKGNRDNFREKTKRSLRRRAGNRCSNPDCRVPTDGPSDEGPDKINNIGKAAHITAAASGLGARRYKRVLKPEQRRSIKNGIWLCSSCADLIDNDEKTYTIALLKEWKKKAEEQAKREQGKKLPDEYDAVNTLTAALTGQSGGFLPNLMPNASKAASSYLESLDPRFIVNTSFHKGVTHHVIHPKQPVGFKVAVDQHYSREFSDKFNNLIKHGENIVLDSFAVRLEGFHILEKILENTTGTIEFIKFPRKNVIIKIQVVSPKSRTEHFYDIIGQAVSGTESITIKGNEANGLISVTIQIFINKVCSPVENEVNFQINFDLWDKKPLNTLPYFDSILGLYRKLKSNWQLKLSVESEGLSLFSLSSNNNTLFTNQFIKLDFIHITREISRILARLIYFDKSFETDSSFYSKVNSIYEVLSKGHYTSPFHERINVATHISKYGYDSLILDKEEDKLCQLRLEYFEQINLYNQYVLLPTFQHTWIAVTPKILNSNMDDIEIDDLVEIEFIPKDDCEYIICELGR